MWFRKPIPIVIPYFNNGHNKGKRQLERCLKCLKEQTIKVKPIIEDDSFTCRRFTKTVNDGLKQCLNFNSDYIMILNQDMYLNNTAVQWMKSFMDDYSKCGICVPIQRHPANKYRVINGGVEDAWPYGKHISGDICNFCINKLYWANGTCMLLRKKMIQEIGLLDENFKLICSDSDYSFTARARGWEIWMDPIAYGIHECGVSRGNTTNEMNAIKVRDMLYFAKKWITGDLYRTMCYEKDKLTEKYIKENIKISKERLFELIKGTF